MNIYECANCLVHDWKQVEDKTKLQQCTNCKLILYCSKECQTEHWDKVHKKQCKYFADPSKALKWGHKEEKCVICQLSAAVGKSKITETNNPNYECIYTELVQKLPPSLYHSHPFPIMGQPGDIKEKSVIVLWQLLRKYQLTQPKIAFICRDELGKLFASLGKIRLLTWINRKVFPRPEAQTLPYEIQKDIKRNMSSIAIKIVLIERHEVVEDPFQLWKIILLITEMLWDVGTSKMIQFLKDPLISLPEKIEKHVSQSLNNIDKYLSVAHEVLNALATQVISYQDILKIICGGSLRQKCSLCLQEIVIRTVEWKDECASAACFNILFLGMYTCESVDCRNKVAPMKKDCDRFGFAMLTLWEEREANACDFCFRRTPVKLKKVESKKVESKKVESDIHRCSRCLSTMYCSNDCLNQDDEIHAKICLKDEEGRKKKHGASGRRKEARDTVRNMETLFLIGTEEIHEVVDEFNLKYSKK